MHIDKIKQLLSKSNCTPELVDSICESLQQYKQQVDENANKEIAKKVELAKKVVLEEVEEYKKELAGQIQVFCESRISAIDKQLIRQSAAGETESKARLQKIGILLEGLDMDKPSAEIAAKLAAQQEENRRLSEKLTIFESRQKEAVKISKNALAENRKLLAENAQLKNNLTAINEGFVTGQVASITIPAKKTAQTGVTKPTKANVTKPAKVVLESVNEPTGTDIISKIASSM